MLIPEDNNEKHRNIENGRDRPVNKNNYNAAWDVQSIRKHRRKLYKTHPPKPGQRRHPRGINQIHLEEQKLNYQSGREITILEKKTMEVEVGLCVWRAFLFYLKNLIFFFFFWRDTRDMVLYNLKQVTLATSFSTSPSFFVMYKIGIIMFISESH